MWALVLFVAVIPWVYLWSVLPFRFLHAFSSLLSKLFYGVFNYRKRLVESNIKKAFPNISKEELLGISTSFYTHFTDLLIEIIKGVTMSNSAFKKRFKVVNFEEIEGVLDSGKSVVLMAAHLNNWEWTSALALYTRHPFYAIYQRLNNNYFDAFMRKNRARTGLHLLPTYQTKATIERHQKENKVALYGFLSDQSPTLKKAKLWTTFFDRYVPAHTGAEELARKHDMAVFYMHLEKVKRSHYKATFSLIALNAAQEEEFEITKKFLCLTEQSVRKQPQNYLWTHRRFKHESG